MPRKSKKKKKVLLSTRPNFRGKGGIREIYNTARNWSNAAGRPFMDAGRTLLDMFFPGAGVTAKRVMNLLGWGAYSGAKNTVLQASPVPTIHAMPDRGVRVIHKEFLTELSSSVSFSSSTYPINPGMPQTFPWLSGVASNFQKYRLNGLIFYFKSTAANVAYSTNNALGTIVGVTQYNVYDTAPVALNQALNTAGVMEEKPTRDCIFPVECDKFHAIYPAMFVRNKAVTDDQAKYDPGKFVLCTSGSQAAAVVGQLWVAYDITLIQPIPASLSTGDVPAGGSVWEMSGSYTTGSPFCTTTLVADNLECAGGGSFAVDGSSVTFPPFLIPTNVVIHAMWIVDSSAFVAPTVTSTNVYNSQTKFSVESGTVQMTVLVTVSNPTLSGTVSVSGGTAPSSPALSTVSLLEAWAYPTGHALTCRTPSDSDEKEDSEGSELAFGNTAVVVNNPRSKLSSTTGHAIKENKNDDLKSPKIKAKV